MAYDSNSANITMTEGLDLFAAAWLEQWVSAGGSVNLSDNGAAQLGYPEFSGSPLYTEVDDANRAAGGWRYESYLFCDGQYHGRMKTLLELLNIMPCGRAAISAHMISHGMKYYYPASGKSELMGTLQTPNQ